MFSVTFNTRKEKGWKNWLKMVKFTIHINEFDVYQKHASELALSEIDTYRAAH